MSVFRSISGFFSSIAGDHPPAPPPAVRSADMPSTSSGKNIEQEQEREGDELISEHRAASLADIERSGELWVEVDNDEREEEGSGASSMPVVPSATMQYESSSSPTDSEASSSVYSPSNIVDYPKSLSSLGVDSTDIVCSASAGADDSTGREVGGASPGTGGGKVSRRTSMGSCTSLHLIEPPDELDMSHLSEEEQAMIAAVMEKARLLAEDQANFDEEFPTEEEDYYNRTRDEGERAVSAGDKHTTQALGQMALNVPDKCNVCGRASNSNSKPGEGEGQTLISEEFVACVKCGQLICVQCRQISKNECWCQTCWDQLESLLDAIRPPPLASISSKNSSALAHQLSSSTSDLLPASVTKSTPPTTGTVSISVTDQSAFHAHHDESSLSVKVLPPSASVPPSSVSEPIHTSPNFVWSIIESVVEPALNVLPPARLAPEEHIEELDSKPVWSAPVRPSEFPFPPPTLEDVHEADSVWRLIDNASPYQPRSSERPRNLILSRQHASTSLSDSPTDASSSAGSSDSEYHPSDRHQLLGRADDVRPEDASEKAVETRPRDFDSDAVKPLKLKDTTKSVVSCVDDKKVLSNERSVPPTGMAGSFGGYSTGHRDSSSSSSSASDRNQSPSRRHSSPKSPPRSPSWAHRFRESPTRSPPIVSCRATRSPQISPCSDDRYPASTTLMEGETPPSVVGMPSSERDREYEEECRRTPPYILHHYDLPTSSRTVAESERLLDSGGDECDDVITRREEGDIGSSGGEEAAMMTKRYLEAITDDDYSIDLASYAASVASGTAHLTSMSVSPACSMTDIVTKRQSSDTFRMQTNIESRAKEVNHVEAVHNDMTDFEKQLLILPPGAAAALNSGLSSIGDVSLSTEREPSSGQGTGFQVYDEVATTSDQRYSDVQLKNWLRKELDRDDDDDYERDDEGLNASSAAAAGGDESLKGRSSLETSPTATTFKRCASYSNIQSVVALAEVLESKMVSTSPTAIVSSSTAASAELDTSLTVIGEGDCFDLSAFQEFKRIEYENSSTGGTPHGSDSEQEGAGGLAGPGGTSNAFTDSFTDEWFDTIVSRKPEHTNPFSIATPDSAELTRKNSDDDKGTTNPFSTAATSRAMHAADAVSKKTNPFSTEQRSDSLEAPQSNNVVQLSDLSPSFLAVETSRREHSFLSDDEEDEERAREEEREQEDEEEEEEDREIDLDEDIPPKHLIVRRARKTSREYQDEEEFSLSQFGAAEMKTETNQNPFISSSVEANKQTRRRLPSIPRERDTDEILTSLLLSPDDSPVRPSVKVRSTSADGRPSQLPPVLPSSRPPAFDSYSHSEYSQDNRVRSCRGPLIKTRSLSGAVADDFITTDQRDGDTHVFNSFLIQSMDGDSDSGNKGTASHTTNYISRGIENDVLPLETASSKRAALNMARSKSAEEDGTGSDALCTLSSLTPAAADDHLRRRATSAHEKLASLTAEETAAANILETSWRGKVLDERSEEGDETGVIILHPAESYKSRHLGEGRDDKLVRTINNPVTGSQDGVVSLTNRVTNDNLKSNSSSRLNTQLTSADKRASSGMELPDNLELGQSVDADLGNSADDNISSSIHTPGRSSVKRIAKQYEQEQSANDDLGSMTSSSRPQRPVAAAKMVPICGGVRIPSAFHTLHLRVKDELKIVTAARRLKIDEAEEVRMMEAELASRAARGAGGRGRGGEGGAARSLVKDLERPSSGGVQKQIVADSRRYDCVDVNASNIISSTVSLPQQSSYSPQTKHISSKVSSSHHKRQTSDPMFAKFSPIEEDRSIESAIKSNSQTLPSKSLRSGSSQFGSPGIPTSDLSYNAKPIRLGTALLMHRTPDGGFGSVSSASKYMSISSHDLDPDSFEASDYEAYSDDGVCRRSRRIPGSASVSSLPVMYKSDIEQQHQLQQLQQQLLLQQWQHSGAPRGTYDQLNGGIFDDRAYKEEKLYQLQMEIEKRRQHLNNMITSCRLDDPYAIPLGGGGGVETSYNVVQPHESPAAYRRQSPVGNRGLIKPIDYQIDPEKYYVRNKSPSGSSCGGVSFGEPMFLGSTPGGSITGRSHDPAVYTSYDYVTHKSESNTPSHQLVSDRDGFDWPARGCPGAVIGVGGGPHIDELQLAGGRRAPAFGVDPAMRYSASGESFIYCPAANYGSGSRDSGVSSGGGTLGTADSYVTPVGYRGEQPSPFDDYQDYGVGSGFNARSYDDRYHPSSSQLVPCPAYVHDGFGKVVYTDGGQGYQQGYDDVNSEVGYFTTKAPYQEGYAQYSAHEPPIARHGGSRSKYATLNTPSMPILDDVKDKSRNRLRDIGSRPLSDDFEKYFQTEAPLDMMYRYADESEYSIADSNDENILEGGLTIQQQMGKRQPMKSPSLHQKYNFPTKRILLTADVKDRNFRKNGFGLKIVGGHALPWAKNQFGAYVSCIYPGSVADKLHGELQEGDEILEWNGESLTGRTYEEIQKILSHSNCEVELLARPGVNLGQMRSNTTSTMAHSDTAGSSYDNMDFVSSSEDALDNELKFSKVPTTSFDKSFLDGSVSARKGDLCNEVQSGPSFSHSDDYLDSTCKMDRNSSLDVSGPLEAGETVDIGEIQLQLSFDNYDGTLNVHVMQARNLRPMYKNGYADPFVKVYLLPYDSNPDRKQKTKCVPRTLNPEWHRTLVFLNIPTSELPTLTVEVSVWDHDRFKPNQLIGEVLFDLSDCTYLDNRPHWYALQEDCPSRYGKRPRTRTVSSSDSGSNSSHASRRQDPDGGSGGTSGRRADGTPRPYDGGGRTGGAGGSNVVRSGEGRLLNESRGDSTGQQKHSAFDSRGCNDSSAESNSPIRQCNEPGIAPSSNFDVDKTSIGLLADNDEDRLHESISQELLFHGIGLPIDGTRRVSATGGNKEIDQKTKKYIAPSSQTSRQLGTASTSEGPDRTESKFVVNPLLQGSGSFHTLLSALFCCLRPPHGGACRRGGSEAIYENTGPQRRCFSVQRRTITAEATASTKSVN